MRSDIETAYWLGWARGYYEGMSGSDPEVGPPTADRLGGLFPTPDDAPLNFFADGLAKAEARLPAPAPVDPEIAQIERYLDENEIDPLWSVERMWKALGDTTNGVYFAPSKIELVQKVRNVKLLQSQGGGDL